MNVLLVGLWLASGAVGLAATGRLLRARYGSSARAWARAEAQTTRSIASVGGLAHARVSGTLRLVGAPLHAPLSGRPCAAYHAAVEDGDRALGAETRFTSFVVEDASGSALVAMDQPLLDVTMDHVWRASQLDAETRFEVEELLAGLVDITALPAKTKDRLVYREGALTPGEQVTVIGQIVRGAPRPAEHPYRDGEDLPCIRGGRGAPLLVSDRLHLF